MKCIARVRYHLRASGVAGQVSQARELCCANTTGPYYTTGPATVLTQSG